MHSRARTWSPATLVLVPSWPSARRRRRREGRRAPPRLPPQRVGRRLSSAPDGGACSPACWPTCSRRWFGACGGTSCRPPSAGSLRWRARSAARREWPFCRIASRSARASGHRRGSRSCRGPRRHQSWRKTFGAVNVVVAVRGRRQAVGSACQHGDARLRLAGGVVAAVSASAGVGGRLARRTGVRWCGPRECAACVVDHLVHAQRGPHAAARGGLVLTEWAPSRDRPGSG